MSFDTVVRVDSELREIVPPYLENRKRDAITLADALGKGDFQTIELIGHRIRGSAGGYGFGELGEIGSRMEEAARSKDLPGLRAEVERLASYLACLVVVYDGSGP
jgi:HPt (histidine-containing phosphotransfer) domain-containing protein